MQGQSNKYENDQYKTEITKYKTNAYLTLKCGRY